MRGITDILLLIIVVIFLFFIYQQQPAMAGSTGDTSSSQFSVNVDLGDQEGTLEPSPAADQRADLCQLAAPYQFTTNCVAAGGELTCNDHMAACIGTTTLIDCATPLMNAARTQCNSAGAIFQCDIHNVQCYYQ